MPISRIRALHILHLPCPASYPPTYYSCVGRGHSVRVQIPGMIRVNFHPVVRRGRFTAAAAAAVPLRHRGRRLCNGRFVIGIIIRRRRRRCSAAVVTGFSATRSRIIAVLAQSPLIFLRVVCVAVTHGQMTNGGGGGGRGGGLLLLPRLSGGMICVGAGYLA